MAQAIKRLYPQADFAFGPATDNGFYYDVDLGDTKLTDEDLANIEKEMKKICKENLPIKPFILPRDKAIQLMEERGEKYKVEHINDLKDETEFSFFQQGEYVDMCIGPHLTYTKALKAFKITQQSGAYWKNDKNNKMLTRINGIAFRNQEELERLPQAAGGGRPPRPPPHRQGNAAVHVLRRGPRLPLLPAQGHGHQKRPDRLLARDPHQGRLCGGFHPLIMNRHLWETSGHWDHYKDNMYATKIDDEDYCIKPMNCPGGVMVYRSQPHSYRELPMRVGELGLVHRHELRGALHGLFRVRCFTQDDAHIFIRPGPDHRRDRGRCPPDQPGVQQVRL